MTWVPPYAVGKCKERLDQSFGGVGMKDGLTHLGLQFWMPTADGGLKVVDRFGKIEESTIAEFQKWGKKNGVRILLCVYNGTPAGWDWDLAKAAFDKNREKFIDALVKEVVRLKLDGVDIDLEGNGKLDDSKEFFVRFIKELSARLRAKGKELTVDTFAYKWNAPNQTWWSSILPHVDGLHVMSYSETGTRAAHWRSYDFIKAAAGDHASKLQIGMTTNAAEWQGEHVSKKLQWVINDSSVGVAIWDAQLRNPEWRTKKMWQTVAQIKGRKEQVQKKQVRPNAKD